MGWAMIDIVASKLLWTPSRKIQDEDRLMVLHISLSFLCKIFMLSLDFGYDQTSIGTNDDFNFI